MDVPKPQDHSQQGSPLGPHFLADEAKFADTFRRDHPLAWWGTLVGPFLITGAMLMSIAMERGVDYMLKLLGNAAATFFFLGRFAILAAGDPTASEATLRLSRFEAFSLVTWMDAFVACMLVFHGSLIFRIPYLGPRLAALREDAEFVLHEHPWIRRFTFLGLAVFVAFPVAATGSVAGSIFARLLGLSRPAGFAAIVAGSCLGNGLMFIANKALAGTPILNPNHPLNLALGLGLIVGIIVLLNFRYRRMKKRWAERTGRPPGSNSRPNAA
jgi:hypothetical protein